MDSSTKRHRLSLELSRPVYEELVKVASNLGISWNEMFRRGIVLLHVAVEEKKKGHRLALIDDETEKVTTIIVGY